MRLWPLLGVSLVVTLLSACTSEDDGSTPAGPCDGLTCSSHGTCVEVDEEARCECDQGYVEQGLMCIDPEADLPTTDQIVQWGIAFTFDDQYQFGSYANGDYWVLGPVVVTGTIPEYAAGFHGWEVNPADIVAQGFDSRIQDFDEGRIPPLPYSASPGESVTKAVSLSPSNPDCRPCLQTAAVLTVVEDVPPDFGRTVFRPPYFGAEKTIYSTDDLDVALLPALQPVDGSPPLDELVARFQRVQLDHKTNWTGRAMHPADNMPDYGSDIATRDADGALRLMLDDDVEVKMPLLIHYVQMGIDLYHMALGGQSWPPGGGHGEGRKLPVAFAGLLLGDAAMQQFVSSSDREQFGENGGMYYSENAGEVLFGQTPNSEESYWTNLVFDTGSRTIIDPYGWIDGGHEPGGSYQFCCTAMAWKATAAAIYLLDELRDVWNHEDFFTYVDRWVASGAWTQPDPCAPPDGGHCVGGDNPGSSCTLASAPAICSGDDAYCDTTGSWDDNYGVTYGPDGEGGCILDTDDSDGTGRFPLLHGVNADGGYHGSGFAEAMWQAYQVD